MNYSLFGLWFKTAYLFLFRSARSTVVLSLMVVTAVTSLIFLSSLAVGVNDAMIRNSVSLYSGHISGFALPSGLKTENLLVEGVASVLKRISIPVILFPTKTISKPSA
jgi:ABC-type lipoprotein release transport system permease subunit